MRQKIVAGNWKMNCTKDEANQLAHQLSKLERHDASVAVFAPSIHLTSLQDKIGSSINLGAQNCYAKDQGAFTGEISPKMIRSYGLNWVLLGHSERRSHFKEDNALLKDKVDAALANELQIMFCFGETLPEREAGKAEAVVKEQLESSLFHLSEAQFKSIVLAYEPVWAIGTGLAATPQQAQEMHAFIRDVLSQKYGAQIANETSILYGGSVKPHNAQEIFSQPDIDGGLIGGASLQADSFKAIIDAV